MVSFNQTQSISQNVLTTLAPTFQTSDRASSVPSEPIHHSNSVALLAGPGPFSGQWLELFNCWVWNPVLSNFCSRSVEHIVATIQNGLPIATIQKGSECCYFEHATEWKSSCTAFLMWIYTVLPLQTTSTTNVTSRRSAAPMDKWGSCRFRPPALTSQAAPSLFIPLPLQAMKQTRSLHQNDKKWMENKGPQFSKKMVWK